MKLKEIYSELLKNEVFREDLAERFFTHIVFDEHNQPLNEDVPLFQEKPTCYDKGRAKALTGEEELIGRFFLFDNIEHYPEMTLFCFSSPKEIKPILYFANSYLFIKNTMKQTLFILISFACFACRQTSNNDTKIKIDTLVRSEFRTTHKSMKMQDHRRKSLTYFVEINKVSSDFSVEINQSKDYGLSINTDYQPKFSKNPKNHEQRLAELNQILSFAQKDFRLDSLKAISMGLLVSLGDVAIEVSNKFEQKTGNIQDKDYEIIEKLLSESRLTTDLNAIFEPYGISVSEIRCEKLWLRNKKELIGNKYFEAKSQLPENLLDGMIVVQFKTKIK